MILLHNLLSFLCHWIEIKTFNYIFNYSIEYKAENVECPFMSAINYRVEIKKTFSFITLLFNSLIVGICPRDERHAKPISRLWSVDCHAVCHSIRFELKRVYLEPLREKFN